MQALGNGAHATGLPNGLGSPLRAVPYPPVLPLMHPALRGLCKPVQGITIGPAPGKDFFNGKLNISKL